VAVMAQRIIGNWRNRSGNNKEGKNRPTDRARITNRLLTFNDWVMRDIRAIHGSAPGSLQRMERTASRTDNHLSCKLRIKRLSRALGNSETDDLPYISTRRPNVPA